MSIKLAILKSGETIISDIKELISEEKICGYLLNSPQTVSIRKEMRLIEKTEETNTNCGEIQVSLSPWIILTDEKQIPIPTDFVITLVDPLDSIKQMYEEKVNVQNS